VRAGLRRPQVVALVVSLVALATLSTSCAKFLGNLRRDLDDSDPNPQMADMGPTMGGRFAEAGFLGADLPDSGYGAERPVNLNHGERGPASAYDRERTARGWVSREQADANARDRYRHPGGAYEEEGLNSSNTPAMLPSVRRAYKNGSRATRADFMDESQSEGSLWASDGQTNYFFTKNKVRGVGDIITLNIEADLYKDIGMEVKRTLTMPERQKELDLVYERNRNALVAKLTQDQLATSQAAATGGAAPAAAPTPAPTQDAAKAPATQAQPTPTPSPSATPTATPTAALPSDKEIDAMVPRPSMQDVDIYPVLELKAGDVMMGEIIDRYPNGNYKIRAVKRTNYKNSTPRMVSLVGIVKGTDISEEDVIASGKLYEYRVEVVR